MTTAETQEPAFNAPQRPAAETSKDMMACEWSGRRDVRLMEHVRPIVSDPKSALIRVSLTSLCCADLQLYHGEFPGIKKGDIFGHEAVGIVEDLGNEVRTIKKGDRVVVSSSIACGSCFYCGKEKFSLCDQANVARPTEDHLGHRNAGLFGYSKQFGGYNGCQAEYIKVPYADINLLKLPDSVQDDKAIFLSDVLSASWHASELGHVTEGKTVAIWGCGAVGLLAIKCALLHGASKVIAIDEFPFRLHIAKEYMGASEVIDISKEKDVPKKIQEYLPGGPDVAIDCVGAHHSYSLLRKVEKAMKLDIDASEVLNEAVNSVRKGGTVAVIGDYCSKADNFPMGGLVDKGVSLRSGPVPVQKYWEKLLGFLEVGDIDPSPLVTHTMPLQAAGDAYRIFDKKHENTIKMLLRPFGIEKQVRAAPEQERLLPSEVSPSSEPTPITAPEPESVPEQSGTHEA